jgi:hypothetical protein
MQVFLEKNNKIANLPPVTIDFQTNSHMHKLSCVYLFPILLLSHHPSYLSISFFIAQNCFTTMKQQYCIHHGHHHHTSNTSTMTLPSSARYSPRQFLPCPTGELVIQTSRAIKQDINQLGSKFRENSGQNSGSGPFSGILGPGVAEIKISGFTFLRCSSK